MKRFVSFYLILFSFFTVSCLQDPAMPDSEPTSPVVEVESGSVTRKSVTVKGSFTDKSSGITEYGFQMAEGSPENWQVIAKNPPKDGAGKFSYTVDGLVQGRDYYFRTYISNGNTVKYSSASEAVRTLPNAVASVTDVTINGCILSASIEDDGGRDILSVGFLSGPSSDLNALVQQGIVIPAVLDADGKHFSAPVGSDFALGETCYFIAYAENAEDAQHTYKGYSLKALPVTVTDAFPAKIAEPVFAEYLSTHFDSNKDGVFSWSELRTIKSIDVITDRITTIQEIALMPELQHLSCHGSAQGSGKLSSLDISQNGKLTALYCDNNELTGLVVAGNPSLDTLSCANNQLTQLEVENNTALRYLDISGNPLTKIDLFSCTKLRTFDARNCPALQRIFVWMGFDKARYPGFKKEDAAEYAPSPSAAVPFADAAFRDYCIDRFDLNRNGEVSVSEAEAVQEITVSTEEVESLQDLKYFTGLQKLSCCGPEEGGRLTSLDLSYNPGLQTLDCRRNQLTLLDISANTRLSELDCTGNPLQRIVLDPDQTVTSLNKPEETPLIYKITGLSLVPTESIMTKDEEMALVVSVLPAETVNEARIRAGITWRSSNDRVASVTQEGVVTAVSTGQCTITASYDGKTASCTISVVIPVTAVKLEPTEIHLHVGATKTIMATVQPINATEKTIVWASDNESVATVSSRGVVTGVSRGSCTITATVGGLSASCLVEVGGVSLTGTYFPDPAFRNHISSRFDKNRDNVLSEEELAAITQIDLPASGVTTVKSMAGVEFFTALQYLNCSGNQFRILDVSANPVLEMLDCRYSPNLKEIWLKTGQTIAVLEYDTEVATIYYK